MTEPNGLFSFVSDQTILYKKRDGDGFPKADASGHLGVRGWDFGVAPPDHDISEIPGHGLVTTVTTLQHSVETFHSPFSSSPVHCGSIRQTATILTMNKDCLRTGDKASVHFRFIKTPEYLHCDQKLVFREGRTKAVGTITKVPSLLVRVSVSLLTWFSFYLMSEYRNVLQYKQYVLQV